MRALPLTRTLVLSLYAAALVTTPVFGQSSRWIRQFGATAPFEDQVWGVASDGSNIYVVGYTLGALSGQTSAGVSDAFIRKYDSAGNLLWSRQFGTANSDVAYAVTADSSGAYVAGSVGGSLGGQTGAGLSDAFLVKYDTAGNVVWTRLVGTAGFDTGYAVAQDSTGVYLAGSTDGTLPGSAASGSLDAFVRKYDINGNALWTRQFGTAQADEAKTLAVSPSGVYVSGRTGGALVQAGAGLDDAFVRKYDTGGNIIWTRQFGTSLGDFAEGSAADANGVYVGGSTGGSLQGAFAGGIFDGYVRMYDNSGNAVWTHQFGTAGTDQVEGVAADSSGVYAGGHTDGTLPGQSSAGGTDLFMRKLNTSGNAVWTSQFGSPSSDFTHDAAVDANGVFLAGGTLGSLPTQASSGSSDGFVASLNNGGGSSGSTLRFVPVSPCRVGDTRLGSGGVMNAPSFQANETRDVPIPSSPCGIPASAKAYSLNITVVPIDPLSFLTTWQSGQPRPLVSTLNSFHGGVVANAAIVPAGTNGSISVYATNRTDVIIDINGYFDNTTAGNSYAYFTTTPCRVADTRNGSGFSGLFGPPSLTAGATRNFPLSSGACSVPVAGAYSLNATVVPPGQLGFLTLWSAGAARPNASTLNSFDGAIVSNAAIVPASAGQISAFASNNTDLILDLNGYFGTPGIIGELYFNAVTPCRVADTREAGQGAPVMAAQETRNFGVVGTCGIPADAKAYSMNVTVVPPAGLSFLTLWPAGQTKPFVSTLNSFLGRVVANAAIVPAGTGGQVSVFVTDQTHVILDINGYFK